MSVLHQMSHAGERKTESECSEERCSRKIESSQLTYNQIACKWGRMHVRSNLQV
jgi:hypothetical protein